MKSAPIMNRGGVTGDVVVEVYLRAAERLTGPPYVTGRGRPHLAASSG
jgi:hypothetical protein